ncbi:pyrokinin-1 receptor-like [Cotesia glomerata]|uniref:G-protein coupled receptors family 1 profile domain-containing protein n=1 Tax=Cotesia glomerata TaxID=32391 RepID=A0AAV7J8A2_COTGL|nr:pyrokinin-1 receptor-like [Cotesia glomerata]KAH0568589.1 hypothetical protein KQX54_021257 [Cotesia glomerata]
MIENGKTWVGSAREDDDRFKIDSFMFEKKNIKTETGIESVAVDIDIDIGSDFEWVSSMRFSDNYTNSLTGMLTASVEASFNQSTTERRDALYVVIPVTIIYAIIFLTGLVGNVSTCVVIARNRSMHTATNYYLFSLAISDLLLLVSGLPPEMYYIWSHFPYIFGESFCMIQSFAAETSANATVLTITAFTVERYVAICHPFLSHTMSKLSRAVKYVVAIWLLALCLAIPQAIQFGVVYSQEMNGTMIMDTAMCSVKWVIIEHAFEISTILLFVGPMTIITVLYILIGIKLRHSRVLTTIKRNPFPGCLNHGDSGRSRGLAQRNVIRMLVAVVVAFFICWAPFHAQRLLAVYAQSTGNEPHAALVTVYTVLTYISGIFYYLSTTVNPLLYNIMSNKFREAFKTMLADHCRAGRSLQNRSPQLRAYSSLSRHQKSTLRRREPHSSSSASDDTHQLAPLTRHNNQGQIMMEHYIDNISPSNNSAGKVINWRTKKNFNKNNNNNNNNNKFTSRSRPGEITLVTSLAKGFNDSCNNNGGISHAINRCFSKDEKAIKPVTIGIFPDGKKAEANGLFLQCNNEEIKQKFMVENELVSSSHQGNKIQSHTSIDSSSTLSNSSLKDLDKTEFKGSELARYMSVLNFDPVT